MPCPARMPAPIRTGAAMSPVTTPTRPPGPSSPSASRRPTRALADEGIVSAFPIQALTVADALAGRDVCGKAKTGSGKTLAFGVPLLQRTRATRDAHGPADGRPPGRPLALVLLPTRELAVQVHDVLAPLAKKLGLQAVAVYGGADIDRQVRSCARGCEVVIATPGAPDRPRRPGRDRRRRRSRRWCSTRPTAWPTWGSCPRSSGCCAASSPPHQTLLFSATLDGAVDRLVKRYLTDPVFHEVASSTADRDADGAPVPPGAPDGQGEGGGRHLPGQEKALLFVRTKRGADRLVENLGKEGVRAAAIHGDLRQANRERALAEFSDGKLPCSWRRTWPPGACTSRGRRRDPLRPARGPQGLPAPLRADRPGRPGGRRGQLSLWNQLVEMEVIQRRLGLRIPIVEMFSNDPRLADLASWTPQPEESVL